LKIETNRFAKLSCAMDSAREAMDKYEIILYWSKEDGVFIAEAPKLPGCMAHGESQEMALENIREAIHLWIKTAVEFGDPVPEPKGRRLMLA